MVLTREWAADDKGRTDTRLKKGASTATQGVRKSLRRDIAIEP